MTQIGATVGHIRVTKFIGAGGMGEVYLGFDETLRRTVAIKTIAVDARLSSSAKARFLREARALSQLDHPHICTIHDYIEGEDSDFLVLEYIEGRNLRQAIEAGMAEALRLTIAEQVADVLVAAHESGVVHRDIKPTNVMLTEDGNAKVLDFGLARLVQADAKAPEPAPDDDTFQRIEPEVKRADTEAQTLDLTIHEPAAESSASDSVYTMRGSVVGTPLYMSPEQARGETATPASDMFSFGLLLRELFTGSSPGEGASAASDRRSAGRNRDQPSAAGLSSSMQRLVERLLAPAPGARPTAAETLERLRWIRGKPKRRNRRILVAAAIAIAVLAGIQYTVDLRRERSQAVAARDQAEELVDFLVGLFEVSDPGKARGRTVTAREILGRGADEVSAELGDQPATQAKLMETIGVVYTNLGLYDEAEPLLERALDQRRLVLGPEALEVADSLTSLAELNHRQAMYPEGEELARRSLEIREARLGLDHIDVAESLHTVGVLCGNLAKFEEAEAALVRAIAIREAGLGVDHPDVAESLRELGIVYHIQGRYSEAEPRYKRALAIREKALGADHPDVGASVNSIAALYFVQGRYEEAEHLYYRALGIREKTLGPDHPDVALCLINIAGLHINQDRLDEAEAVYRRALGIQERALGPDHPDVADCLGRIAQLCSYLGRTDEAESLYRREIAILEADSGAGGAQLAMAQNNLASLLDDTGKYDEAEELVRRALSIRERVLDADDPELAESCFGLAHMYHRHFDRIAEAEALYSRAVTIWARSFPAEHPPLISALTEYSGLLREQGRADEARSLEARIPERHRTGASSSRH